MPKAESKEPKVEIVVSPVYDVIRCLSTVANGASKNPADEELARRVRASLRPRLLANLEKFFDDSCYPGAGLLSLVGENFTKDVPTFLQSLAQLSPTDMAIAMLSFGKIYRGNLRVDGRIEELLANPELLREHIERNMTVPPEKVPGLLEVVLNPEESKDNLAELVEHFWYVIVAPEAERRAQQQQQLAELCQTRLNEQGALRFVTNMTNLYLPDEKDTYEKVILAPSSFCPKSLIATENKEETTLVVIFGPDHHALLVKGAPEYEDCQVVDAKSVAAFHNALSDETRLKIVKMLIERPHYGQELAKILGVSNATVFHHLSLLDKVDIVHLERIEHRVYYVLDTERLKELFEQSSNFILNERLNLK